MNNKKEAVEAEGVRTGITGTPRQQLYAVAAGAFLYTAAQAVSAQASSGEENMLDMPKSSMRALAESITTEEKKDFTAFCTVSAGGSTAQLSTGDFLRLLERALKKASKGKSRYRLEILQALADECTVDALPQRMHGALAGSAPEKGGRRAATVQAKSHEEGCMAHVGSSSISVPREEIQKLEDMNNLAYRILARLRGYGAFVSIADEILEKCEGKKKRTQAPLPKK